MDGIVAHNPDSKTSQLIKDKLNKVTSLAGELQDQYDEREKAIEKSLEASEKFWPGLEDLKHILKDVQENLDAEDPPAADLEVLKEQKSEHEVNNGWVNRSVHRTVYLSCLEIYDRLPSVLLVFCLLYFL